MRSNPRRPVLQSFATSVAGRQQISGNLPKTPMTHYVGMFLLGTVSVRAHAVGRAALCSVLANASLCERRGSHFRGLRTATRLTQEVPSSGSGLSASLGGTLSSVETMVCPATLERTSAISSNNHVVRRAKSGRFLWTDRSLMTSSPRTKVAHKAPRTADAVATHDILLETLTLPFRNVLRRSSGRRSLEMTRLRFSDRWPAERPITPTRVSHGQQNAHRRIPPGRNPGCGAAR